MTIYSPLRLRVHSVVEDGQDIRLFDLRAETSDLLPSFRAGDHIDVEVAPGMVRQYSLLNDPEERFRYVIAVLRQTNGRGGSIRLHDSVAVGAQVTVGAPSGHFGLDETATHSMLIAGGVGITPLWSMIQRLELLGRSWELHYVARTPEAAALLSSVRAVGAGRASLYFSRVPGGERPDLGAIIAGMPPGAYVYACGPTGMMEAFKTACAALPSEQVHMEHFSASAPVVAAGGFTVALAQTKRTIEVKPGQTILQALAENGVRVAYSCREGVCGSCETAVLAGVPDHRDLVLTEAERAAGRTMMVCCSGSLSDRLVLDI